MQQKLTNINSADNALSSYNWIDQAAYIINTYLIRTVGGFGVLINLFLCILLLHKTLVHKLYDFFWSRVFYNFLVCLFAAGHAEACFNCEFDSYWLIIYQYYINRNTGKLLLNASLISENFLTLNRFFEIINKKTCLYEMSKKLILFLSLLLSLLISFPLYFVADIVKGKTNGTFVKQLSRFGSSEILYYYSIFIIVLTVAAIIILFFVNVVSIYKFKLFLESMLI